jgi:hypothetical protein
MSKVIALIIDKTSPLSQDRRTRRKVEAPAGLRSLIEQHDAVTGSTKTDRHFRPAWPCANNCDSTRVGRLLE